MTPVVEDRPESVKGVTTRCQTAPSAPSATVGFCALLRVVRDLRQRLPGEEGAHMHRTRQRTDDPAHFASGRLVLTRAR
ncbi:MAG: hypothetical protein A3F92_12990 [Candidatus Rokubacteria bacterium RIFCSPLOWO2_12_FULL_71_22]|nr:MAG: hypothetical protein A3I17_10800 [Candidatus Rokubacteria bacterium RIFCSPLOWO2_02_FULL_72_37]OGL19706.1 MAG: hypothetical protein A3F92_12990 [Candidatus Rokubacteria bacterium RIFCSPLOWO2_12_FULL_71_22]